MENQDNICVEVSMAGQEKEEKSPYGKFKDANALLQAYNSLEAEFTRRSQRLKRLERDGKAEQADGLTCEAAEVTLSAPLQDTGCQGDGECSDAAGQGLGNSQPAVKAEAEQGVVAESAADALGEKTLDGDGGRTPSSAEVYRLAMQDENVRLRIVGEYLQSLQKGAPISKGGVGALMTPPKRAKTVSDAGNMALRLFLDANKNQH